jgi:hypothetical protein
MRHAADDADDAAVFRTGKTLEEGVAKLRRILGRRRRSSRPTAA